MTDLEMKKEVISNMEKRLEELQSDYTAQLDFMERDLGKLETYLHDCCFNFDGGLDITGPHDLPYINAYLRTADELCKVYRAQIKMNSSMLINGKLRFADSILEEDENDAGEY